MNRSEQIGQLAAALALAQAEMGHAAMDSENPGFKRGAKVSRYADLASVIDCAKPVLPKNGLSITQLATTGEDNRVGVETVLMHTSGEWISSVLLLPAGQESAQGFGSALTYARRYAYAAICGIAQDDDDGNEASGRDKDGQKKPAPDLKLAQPAPRTQDQVENVTAALDFLGIPSEAQKAYVDALNCGDVKTHDGAARLLVALDARVTEKVNAAKQAPEAAESTVNPPVNRGGQHGRMPPGAAATTGPSATTASSARSKTSESTATTTTAGQTAAGGASEPRGTVALVAIAKAIQATTTVDEVHAAVREWRDAINAQPTKQAGMCFALAAVRVHDLDKTTKPEPNDETRKLAKQLLAIVAASERESMATSSPDKAKP